MPDIKRHYQVFVSSTYQDLKEERDEVIRALLELRCFPCAMEFFPASNKSALEYVEPLIKSSDYYLILVGGSYGSTTDKGVSYTQNEYEIAQKNDVPIVAFIHSDWQKLLKTKEGLEIEEYQSLEQFVAVLNRRLNQKWSEVQDLKSKVITTMVSLFEDEPRVGWIKGDAKTTAYYSLLEDKQSLLEENKSLQSKIDYLENRSLHSPLESFRDFDAAWPTIENLLLDKLSEASKDNEKLKLRIMGVCLHKSFPRIKSFLLERDLLGATIEIRLSVLSPQCDVWQRLDGRWNGLRKSFDDDLDDLVKMLEKMKERNELKSRISIKYREYDYVPNFHGMMINKKEIFMSSCTWDSDRHLKAGQNIYEYYREDISELHASKITFFRRWFDYGRYQSRIRTNKQYTFDSSLPQQS